VNERDNIILRYFRERCHGDVRQARATVVACRPYAMSPSNARAMSHGRSRLHARRQVGRWWMVTWSWRQTAASALRRLGTLPPSRGFGAAVVDDPVGLRHRTEKPSSRLWIFSSGASNR